MGYMKLNKVIVAVEELEARLVKDISQKAGNSHNLKRLLARGGFVSKSDLTKLEHKYELRLNQMKMEIDDIKARMITRETLKKWERQIKKKLIVYTSIQLTICAVFFVLL